MVESYKKLREESKETLIQKYDVVAPHTVSGLNYYRDEIARRDAEEQSLLILNFTKQMRDMTVAITVMTGLVLVLTMVNVYLVWPK
ncbi:hypothetical protein [Ensifer sp. 1H6]|uniref:hypothetical protein n=1 Tax=Ensifer sp. 1H6 TaxID=1911585 RepID=UPI0009CC2372|nr:hypothetical protein [Ensifer sp. 1H6]OMQ42075.1 hypothetical protein BKP54_25380 [Ensifer sp. 1H6]